MAKRKAPHQPQSEVQVDLKKAETIKCDDCGNYLFITSHVIKRISPIMSPTGQEALVPVQVYSCGNCGKVPKMFIEGAGLGLEEVNKPKEDALSRPDLMG
jgi:DNA-directed RNA polymerase subunit RPC12/RpoP|tara:strand:+ start:316 stop:615 length:300 start_codon:yes stop_codon:yes gene_type:complete